MSGGSFDYRDCALIDLQDMVAREIGELQYGSNNNCDDCKYNSKTIEYMKTICSDLGKLSKVMRSLDWFLSGDASEEKFISDFENVYMEQKDE